MVVASVTIYREGVGSVSNKKRFQEIRQVKSRQGKVGSESFLTCHCPVYPLQNGLAEKNHVYARYEFSQRQNHNAHEIKP